MNITGLFPIPIATFEFDGDLPIGEFKFVNALERRTNSGNESSDAYHILRLNELSTISDFCEKALKQYAKEIYQHESCVEFYITQSWANFTETGGHHHRHAHQNSLVSGVFYINADEQNDKIHFAKDQYNTIDIPPTSWNLYNSKTWWMPAKTGSLILFPSSLIHFVESTVSANERVSIAFNSFVKGTIGSYPELTGLKL